MDPAVLESKTREQLVELLQKALKGYTGTRTVFAASAVVVIGRLVTEHI